MSLRHISRVIVFQTIYCLDSKDCLDLDIENAKTEMSKILELLDISEKDLDHEYAVTLIKNILDRRITIDEILQRAAPDWPLYKIHSVDRNILRLSICELLFSPHTEVPMKVAINESIEIAKEYGSENSGKFVNGVLGHIYREICDVHDIQSQQVMQQEIKNDTSYIVKHMIGVLLYKTENGQKYFGCIYDIFRHWGACKSEINPEQDLNQNIIRIIKKEFGNIEESQINNVETIGTIDFVTNDKDKKLKVKKQVQYYLVDVDAVIADHISSNGVSKSDWLRIDDKLLELRFYPDFKNILDKAIEKVSWNK
jgi:N utilization substance protein B